MLKDAIEDYRRTNLDNVLNTDYIATAINRFTVLPGTPFNARLTIKYSF